MSARAASLSVPPSAHQPSALPPPPPLILRPTQEKKRFLKKIAALRACGGFDKMGADNVKRLPETKLPCKARA